MRRLRAATATLVATAIPIGAAFGLAYPFARGDYQAFVNRPMIRTAVTRTVPNADGSFTVDVMLENSGNRGLSILGNEIEIGSMQGRFYVGPAEFNGSPRSAFFVAPNDHVLITSRVAHVPNSKSGPLSGQPLGSAVGRIALHRLSLAGDVDDDFWEFFFDDDDPWVISNFSYGQFDDEGASLESTTLLDGN